MTTDYLTKLREAGEKATAGPWKAAGTIDQEVEPWDIVVGTKTEGRDWMSHDVLVLRANDAAFIALARNAWPAIVEVLRASHAVAEQISEQLEPNSEEKMLAAALAKLQAAVEGEPND